MVDAVLDGDGCYDSGSGRFVGGDKRYIIAGERCGSSDRRFVSRSVLLVEFIVTDAVLFVSYVMAVVIGAI